MFRREFLEVFKNKLNFVLNFYLFSEEPIQNSDFSKLKRTIKTSDKFSLR